MSSPLAAQWTTKHPSETIKRQLYKARILLKKSLFFLLRLTGTSRAGVSLGPSQTAACAQHAAGFHRHRQAGLRTDSLARGKALPQPLPQARALTASPRTHSKAQQEQRSKHHRSVEGLGRRAGDGQHGRSHLSLLSYHRVLRWRPDPAPAQHSLVEALSRSPHCPGPPRHPPLSRETLLQR